MRLGIIGTNFISDNLVAAARNTDGVEIAAVYSRKRDTGAAFAEKHPEIGLVFDDLDAFLASGAIDAVYVASPIVAHARQTILALRHGKHVLCEKMMAHTLAAAEKMRSVAAECGRVLLEAMRPAHDPAYDTLRALLPKIGKIKSATLEFRQYSSRYDRFKSGVVMNAFDPTMYNSALSDIGIYPLHVALVLFGQDGILKSAESEILHNGFEADGRLIIGYDGFDAEILYSKIRNSVAPSVIVGEQGSITVDKISQPTSLILTCNDGGIEQYSFAPPDDNNMTYELAAFRDMCDGRLDPTPYLDLTMSAQSLVDRAYRASGASRTMPPLDAVD